MAKIWLHLMTGGGIGFDPADLIRCIESCKDQVDGIKAALDDRDTGIARAILESYGTEIYPFHFENDWGKPRNDLLLSNTPEGDWVLNHSWEINQWVPGMSPREFIKNPKHYAARIIVNFTGEWRKNEVLPRLCFFRYKTGIIWEPLMPSWQHIKHEIVDRKIAEIHGAGSIPFIGYATHYDPDYETYLEKKANYENLD